MKFLIEALGLTSGGGRGIVSGLVPALARNGGHQFVAVLAHAPENAALAAPNLKIAEFDKRRGLLRRARFLNRTVPSICREERADALLCLGNFAPCRLPIPAIISLRNAFFVGPPPEACRGLSRRERLIARYARRQFRRLPTGVFLTVETELMKQKFLEAYPLEPERVAVISNGLSRQSRFSVPYRLTFDNPLASLGQRPASKTSRSRASADCFTFLCLARYYTHKNIEMGVAAMKQLASCGRTARLWITVDPADHPAARRLLRRIRREGLEDFVQNLGTLPFSALPSVFAAADAVLLPTLLESFSRTYLEAMQYEVPILTSDRDFTREICGSAALYFDPLDVASVSAAMTRMMDDAALRRSLAARGLERAALFPDWDEIAAQFAAALESVADGHGLPAASRAQPAVALDA